VLPVARELLDDDSLVLEGSVGELLAVEGDGAARFASFRGEGENIQKGRFTRAGGALRS